MEIRKPYIPFDDKWRAKIKEWDRDRIISFPREKLMTIMWLHKRIEDLENENNTLITKLNKDI